MTDRLGGANPAASTPWADETLVDLVRKHWLTGESATRLAARVKSERGIVVSRNQIMGKVTRLGLHRSSAAEIKSAALAKQDAVIIRRQQLRAPAVARDLYASTNAINARGNRPPKPGPQNKPDAVFGAVEVVNAEETEKRRLAAQAQGEKIKAAFSEPANDNAIRLIQRGRFQCSWPVGEPDRPANQMCCGQPVVEGANKSVETYCEAHARKAVARVLVGGKPDAKRYERSMRRYA